jgi:hypothetical protein
MPFRLILLTIVLTLGPAAAAEAAWFPAQTIDGPNADVMELGGIDAARDGTGAVAYLRRDGGLPHVFVSRLSGGAWLPPVRVDVGTGVATEVKVAAGDGNRLAVAWVADGNVYAASTPHSAAPAPFSPVSQIGGPGAKSVDVDLGVNDAAYAVWQQGGDIRAARLMDAAWSGIANPLDITATNDAGTGAQRPKVAVSAEGYAVATWGETSDRTRVYARRLTGLNLSSFPQQVSQDADGGNADSPDIDIEDDGSFAWVTYRQDIGGASRSMARRLVGSTFDAAGAIDGGIASLEPRIDMNGRGQGEGVAQATDNSVLGALLDRDVFETSYKLDSFGSTAASKPEVAASDRGDLAVAWRAGFADGSVQARARLKPYRQAFASDTQLSNSTLGPVADPGVYIAGDRVGDFAVGMVQGLDGARALSVASYDDPPGAPFIGQAQAYKRQSRPELGWRPGVDLWGEQRYRVLVDGAQIGETKASTFVPTTPLKAGKHVWQVEAVDGRGQTSRSRARTLRIDSLAPLLTVKVSGKRARGQTLKISVKVKDVGGSGLDHTTIDYGDRSATTRARSVRHRYRAGRFTLKVAAVDKAGNIARKAIKLRIKT